MVWGLFPVDPLPGEERYYIFKKGTYKVGRKGCDVIVNKDKGVSRIHAEIVVDAMAFLEHQQNKSSNMSSEVRIRDCSKYGTFINKNLGAKEKVHEFPNKETTLKDGYLISFGTGNATYRFCFVPLMIFVYCSEPSEANQLLQENISSIGACMTHNWNPNCTHVLVNQSMPLTEDVIDAFVAKKPFVLKDWIGAFAGKNISTEIPSCTSHAPTLMLEGISVKVADPKSRENCLRGYSFVLDLTHKYKFKDKLWSLLEMVGAEVVSVEGFHANSQGLEDEDKKVVLVIPLGSLDKFVPSRNLSSLYRVKEMDLICAAFSGHLDPSTIVAAPVVISSSCSTDETVVADSDEEAETAISVDMSAAVITTECTKHEIKKESSMDHAATRLGSPKVTCSTDKGYTVMARRDQVDKPESGNPYINSSDGDNTILARRDHVDEPENGNPDIIYSQILIVRDTNVPVSDYSSIDAGVPNFKCFKKYSRTPSGNSFNNLIPFSKYPYKDSDYGSEEVVESVKEEKKRKQMEALAEDLFNNERGRKRGVAGSLRGILTRS
ncbi:nibrin homolog [Actinidia eriantha]|uniref:nibrin homolog n=1 Tax=Actinidia eriantha TaxID=165200 RepID=UPI00258A083B|nr:nibrin homolog [Actinidia eriantha]